MIRNTIVLGSIAAAVLAAADKGTEAPKTPPTPPAVPVAAAAGITVLAPRNDVARPANAKKAGAKSKYDFASLEVGGSFGVIGKTAHSFNSIIYNVETKVFGEKILNADGTEKMRVKKLKEGGTELVNETRKTREFSAFDVDPKADPEGATVRVFRDK